MNDILALLFVILVFVEFLATILIGSYLTSIYFAESDTIFRNWFQYILDEYVVVNYQKMNLFGCIIFTIGLLFMFPSFCLAMVFVVGHKICRLFYKFGKLTMFKKD